MHFHICLLKSQDFYSRLPSIPVHHTWAFTFFSLVIIIPCLLLHRLPLYAGLFLLWITWGRTGEGMEGPSSTCPRWQVITGPSYNTQYTYVAKPHRVFIYHACMIYVFYQKPNKFIVIISIWNHFLQAETIISCHVLSTCKIAMPPYIWSNKKVKNTIKVV